ncbi:MAG: ABC transporter ATP-binding protein, partial [Enterococcus sp.]|nr:ABC transporter ATP-binding protein [Enterococcus sp.]
VAVNSFVQVIIMFIMMLLINPALTFIAVIIVPMSLFSTFFIIKKAGKHFKGRQTSMGQLNGFIEEAYEVHNVISVCNKEEKAKEEFEGILSELFDHSWKADFAASAMMPITMSLTNFAYAAVTLIASFMVISGQFTIGMIQGFTQYMRNFGQPITDLAQISNIFQQTRAAAARVFEFVDEKEETPDKEDCVVPENVKGIVEFEHVEFGYDPSNILIHDLSVNINPGDKVAIVGPTGAGKTTLVNLLLRFYEISKGTISVDGVSVSDMTRETLRSNISMVLQDAWLFSGTIMENIRYGRLNASDEEVYKAAKEAQCHNFIKKLPGGYKFKLSESASNLAQGQRQLITIARAILADCPILILDEATSSVDTRTEKLIQKAMANVMENRTSFVIAHRLSTIRDSELILYMQDGDILEQGNHRELMNKNGLYAKLYNSQF